MIIDSFIIEGISNIGHVRLDVGVEKPSVFDPRGQAMLTLTGKI